MKQTITLVDGLPVEGENGEERIKTFVIRESSAGDMIDAQEEAEKVHIAPDGSPVIMASPTRVGVEIMRRQVASYGSYEGPLSLAELRKLSPRDLELLRSETEGLDNAAMMRGLESRGRD